MMVRKKLSIKDVRYGTEQSVLKGKNKMYFDQIKKAICDLSIDGMKAREDKFKNYEEKYRAMNEKYDNGKRKPSRKKVSKALPK